MDKISNYGHNWTFCTKIDQNRTKLVNINIIGQFGPKMDKSGPKLDKIDQKCTKWTKISKTGQNGPILVKVDKMDQNETKSIVDQPVHPG